MRLPPLNTLRMFDAAARHLNFRRAADELGLTQGAVAQQVRRLEAELGVKLFHRQPRGLALSDPGRRYATAIRQALAIIEAATAGLRPAAAKLTISVPPSFATKWLVPRLKSFSNAHPDIEIRTVASETLADFRWDGVDLAIRQGASPVNPNLQARLLAPLYLHAVCAPGYLRQDAVITAVNDLARHTLIYDGHDHWDRLLERGRSKPAPHALRFNQTALAMDAAAAGQGIALVPKILAEIDLAQGTLITLWRDEQPDQHGYYLVRPNTPPSRADQAMIDWLFAELKVSR